MARDDDELQRLFGELVALADVGDLTAAREAIGELDREDTGELLLVALARIASLDAAASLGLLP
jgi:hypothetical protein